MLPPPTAPHLFAPLSEGRVLDKGNRDFGRVYSVQSQLGSKNCQEGREIIVNLQSP